MGARGPGRTMPVRCPPQRLEPWRKRACRGPVSGLADDGYALSRGDHALRVHIRWTAFPPFPAVAHGPSCFAYRCGGSAGLDRRRSARPSALAPASRFTPCARAARGTPVVSAVYAKRRDAPSGLPVARRAGCKAQEDPRQFVMSVKRAAFDARSLKTTGASLRRALRRPRVPDAEAFICDLRGARGSGETNAACPDVPGRYATALPGWLAAARWASPLT